MTYLVATSLGEPRDAKLLTLGTVSSQTRDTFVLNVAYAYIHTYKNRLFTLHQRCSTIVLANIELYFLASDIHFRR